MLSVSPGVLMRPGLSPLPTSSFVDVQIFGDSDSPQCKPLARQSDCLRTTINATDRGKHISLPQLTGRRGLGVGVGVGRLAVFESAFLNNPFARSCQPCVGEAALEGQLRSRHIGAKIICSAVSVGQWQWQGQWAVTGRGGSWQWHACKQQRTLR